MSLLKKLAAFPSWVPSRPQWITHLVASSDASFLSFSFVLTSCFTTLSISYSFSPSASSYSFLSASLRWRLSLLVLCSLSILELLWLPSSSLSTLCSLSESWLFFSFCSAILGLRRKDGLGCLLVFAGLVIGLPSVSLSLSPAHPSVSSSLEGNELQTESFQFYIFLRTFLTHFTQLR